MTTRISLFVAGLATAVALSACGTPKQAAPPEVTEIQISKPLPGANSPVDRPRQHVVARGETLGSIAFKYGLAYQDLALWNNIPNPDLIEVGQHLQLYPHKNLPEVSSVKQVQKKVPKLARASDGAKVTRTQVQVGGGTQASSTAGQVSHPVALKIKYSEKAHEQLLSAASGGATQASLQISEDGPQGALPRNSRNINGIVWSWPVNGKMVKKFSDANRGIDIGGPLGQPVYASADGQVIYAGSGLKGYGQLVIIKHKNEYLSTYAHNNLIVVAEGEQVQRGTKIAEMGDSGAERVALHFGIRRGEEAYDPQRFLPKTP